MPDTVSEESSHSGSSSQSSGQLLGASVRQRSSKFVRKGRREHSARVPTTANAPNSPPSAKTKALDDEDYTTQSPSSDASQSSDLSLLLVTVSPMGDSLTSTSSDDDQPSDNKPVVALASDVQSSPTNHITPPIAEEGHSAVATPTESSEKPTSDGPAPSWQSPCSFPDLHLPSLVPEETGTSSCPIGDDDSSLANQGSQVHNNKSSEGISQVPSHAQSVQEGKVEGGSAEESSKSSSSDLVCQEDKVKIAKKDQEKPESKSIRTIPLGESVRPGRRNRSKMRKQLSSGDVSDATASESSISSSPDIEQCLPSRTPNIYDGNLYRDRSQALAVLSVAESKRQCWLQNEVQAGEREWDYYVSLLDKATQETQQIETYLANSNVALVEYSQAIDAICDGEFKATNPSNVKIEEFIDATSNNPMFGTIRNCYAALKESLEQQLPEMTDSLRQATLLKTEVGKRAAELEKKGKAIGWDDTKRVEETIKDSFEALLLILMQQTDPGEVEPRDRWLAEARYRNSARLSLDTWKATRKAYQTIYSEFWKVEDYRKGKQKKILGGFLPLRQTLMQTTHFAFDAGADVVEGEIQPRNLAKSFSSATADTMTCRSVWNSPYLEDCRVVQLKIGREWRAALAVKTTDLRLHLFVCPSPSLGINIQFPELAETIDTKNAYISASLSDYEISRCDGAVVELIRTGRSMIFRKRQDHLVVQLKDSVDAFNWFERLRSDSRSKAELHC